MKHKIILSFFFYQKDFKTNPNKFYIKKKNK